MARIRLRRWARTNQSQPTNGLRRGRLLGAAALAFLAIMPLHAIVQLPQVRIAARNKEGSPGRKGISGLWSGTYWYGGGDADGMYPVHFNAMIDDVGGALFGDIDEPSTFGEGLEPRLFARLDGERSGLEVRFLKSYDGTNGVDHSVQYIGLANRDYSVIEGRWRIMHDEGGGFRMHRQGASVSIAAEVSAEAEVELVSDTVI
jgi:hypothetical protein